MNIIIKGIDIIINRIRFVNNIIDWFSPVIYFFVRVFIATSVAFVFIENNVEINGLFQFVIIFWVYYPFFRSYFDKIFWRWGKENE